MPHQGQTGVTFNSSGHRLLGTLFLARGDQPKPTAVIYPQANHSFTWHRPWLRDQILDFRSLV